MTQIILVVMQIIILFKAYSMKEEILEYKKTTEELKIQNQKCGERVMELLR